MKGREIKFRGKSIDTFATGEWIYGGYYYRQEWITELVTHHLIINEFDEFKVDPRTVGQFTGLLDRNGKEIYENDLVTHPDCIVEGTKFYVRWDSERARFRLEDKEGKEYLGQLYDNEYIIVGNEFEEVEK